MEVGECEFSSMSQVGEYLPLKRDVGQFIINS